MVSFKLYTFSINFSYVHVKYSMNEKKIISDNIALY